MTLPKRLLVLHEDWAGEAELYGQHFTDVMIVDYDLALKTYGQAYDDSAFSEHGERYEDLEDALEEYLGDNHTPVTEHDSADHFVIDTDNLTRRDLETLLELSDAGHDLSSDVLQEMEDVTSEVFSNLYTETTTVISFIGTDVTIES